MLKTLHQINNLLPETILNEIIFIGNNTTEEQWSLMNEEHLNGPWWNNKRLMIDPKYDQIIENYIRTSWPNYEGRTAYNKIQRFFSGDVLGPIVDKEHVPHLKYGSVLFLEDNPDAGIVFEDNIEIKSTKNTFYIYDASFKFKLQNLSDKTFLNMTFFFH